MRIDAATAEFMDKVASDAAVAASIQKVAADAAQPESHASHNLLSMAKKVVRAGQDPHKIIPRILIGETTKELLKEGTMPPLQIFGTLNQHYARDWWDWEPETVWKTLEVEQGIHTDNELKNMLMAFQVIVQTNAPFEHWHVFEKVGHALNQNPVEFQIIQPLELTEIALTMKVLKAMRPAQGFEDEIYGYTAAAAQSAGVVFLPEAYFGKSQAKLDELQSFSELAKTMAKKIAAGEKAEDEALKIQYGYLEDIKDYVEKN